MQGEPREGNHGRGHHEEGNQGRGDHERGDHGWERQKERERKRRNQQLVTIGSARKASLNCKNHCTRLWWQARDSRQKGSWQSMLEAECEVAPGLSRGVKRLC